MNIRYSVAVIFIMSLLVSEAYGMYSVVRGSPRHYVPAVQLRRFGPGDGGALLFGVGTFAATAVIVPSVMLYGTYKITFWLYTFLQKERYKKDAYGYVRECFSQKVNDFSAQSLEEIDNSESGRFPFLSEAKKRYDQLCFVESLEIQKRLQLNTVSNDNDESSKMLNNIFQHKQKIYDLVSQMDKDMSLYQEKRERFYAKKLGLTAVPQEVSQQVAQEIKTQNLASFITDIKKKHSFCKLLDNEHKQLRYKE